MQKSNHPSQPALILMNKEMILRLAADLLIPVGDRTKLIAEISSAMEQAVQTHARVSDIELKLERLITLVEGLSDDDTQIPEPEAEQEPQPETAIEPEADVVTVIVGDDNGE